MGLSYDPSRLALYSPELRETEFVAGKNYSHLQIGVEAARLAYVRAERSARELGRLEDALKLVGFDTPSLFHSEATDTTAFAAYHGTDALALIAFRGTRPDVFEDFITDVKFRLIDWPESGGRVHEGFATAFRSLRPELDRWLKANKVAPRRVVFAGHSLGAALATLSAAIWEPALLVTLGSPRVGNSKFAASLKSANHIRLVDCCDLITDIPFEMGGYRHAGIALYIDAAGDVVANPSPAFVTTDRTRAELQYLKTHALQPTDNVLLRRLADHAPSNYARAFF
jgi:hypothetical protein